MDNYRQWGRIQCHPICGVCLSPEKLVETLATADPLQCKPQKQKNLTRQPANAHLGPHKHPTIAPEPSSKNGWPGSTTFASAGSRSRFAHFSLNFLKASSPKGDC